jgi:hypothetical protein
MAVKEYAPSIKGYEVKETLEPSAELIAAVDEAFTDQVTALESLSLNPELEAGMGPGIKEAIPNDRTQGTQSITLK